MRQLLRNYDCEGPFFMNIASGDAAIVAAPPSKPSSQSFYRPELDVLRFAAFLGVFLYHAMPHDASAYEPAGPFAPWLAAIFRSGSFGVDLFFALSAYLITTLLLREKEIRGSLDVKSFYLRRILRIWPLYFSFVAFAILLHWLGFRTQSLTVPYIAGYAALAGNWVYAAYGLPHSVAVPLWSLSIEEQFYLVWPLAVRTCSRRRMACVAIVLLIAGSCCTAALMFLAGRTLPGYVLEYNTFVRLDPIALGILLALLFADNTPSISAIKRAGLFSLAAATWIIVSRYCEFKVRSPANVLDNMVGRPAIALATIAILIATLGARGFLINRVTLYLGKISYGLYVIHAFGLLVAMKLLGQYRGPVGSVVVAFAGLFFTIVLAALSYRWLEAPFLSLKGRFTQVDSRRVDVSWTKSPSIPKRSSRAIDGTVFTAISEERETS
jgi:peptidoglycan/LPS O-acetylase OafA/YrhL